MYARHKPPYVPSTFVAIALAFIGAAATLDAGPARRSATNPPLNAFDSAAVERARGGAARRLQGPECSKILTDFKDRQGRTLDQRLANWSLSASEYLKTLPFFGGARVPVCQRKGVHLATTPGQAAVSVCPAGVTALNSRFAQVQAETPTASEFMIIHEMLHTLGLGENPPTSFEITEQVRRRCR